MSVQQKRVVTVVLPSQSAKNSASDEYPEAQMVAENLSAVIHKKLSARDYISWMEGGGDAGEMKFDKAVMTVIGSLLYQQLQVMARLSNYVHYLFGGGPAKVGGIDLSRISIQPPNKYNR